MADSDQDNVSFEKEVETGSRAQLRAPTFEFRRESVKDLPAQKGYQAAVGDSLERLSLQTSAQQFLTLSSVPLGIEFHWSFRRTPPTIFATPTSRPWWRMLTPW